MSATAPLGGAPAEAVDVRPQALGRRLATASDWSVVCGWFVLTRLVVAVSAVAGAAHFRPGNYFQSLGGPPAPAALVPFVRWDSYFYIDIARNGYWAKGSAPVFSAAFFPLYPLAVRALDLVVHETVVASMLLSNACALGASLLLCRLSRLTTLGDGRLAALLFLASPGAGFLSFPYSESLFCLLLAGGLLAAVQDRPWVAAGCGALASATRPTGLVLAVALIARAVERRRIGRPIAAYLVAAAACGAGLIAFGALCQARYGDALYFSHVQAEWGRHVSLLGPVRALFEFAFDPDYYLVTLAALAAAVWLVYRDVRTVLTWPAWALLLVPLSTGSLKSMIRFQGANIPLIAGVAPRLPGRRMVWVLGLSVCLLAYETYEYAAGAGHN